jgi:hypothetical protein
VTEWLMRAADAFFTALLLAIAGLGAALAVARGHGLALLVAMAVVLEVALRVRRAPPRP